ncbi:MAG: ATP-grasp domain-containing protein [Acidobacteria bacterium]|nr:ATP-grasp domain-containing protein [Acidobacteriota bacterium]
MAVFVTDGNQRATLAVVRALGRAGIPVIVGETTERSLASSSRYCSGSAAYPSPSAEEDLFRQFLQREMATGRYRMLLPMTDVTTRLAVEAHAAFPPEVRLPLPTAQQVELAQDKGSVLDLAQRLGIACPETWQPRTEQELELLAARLRYPVVIKPRFSRFRRDGTWVRGDVCYAANAQELAQRYRESGAALPGTLIQERVTGEGLGVFLLLWNGETKAAFCHRRLREKPPWGGVSVYRESIPPQEPLISNSIALLRALEWQGVAMVEYKVDASTGTAKLMEVNGRFWGSLQLASDAGLNFPALLYRLTQGEDVPAITDYRAGVRSRWLLGDLDHLLLRLRGRTPPGGVGIPGSRFGAVLSFLKFWEPNLHYEVGRFEDAAPGWFECRSWLRDVFRS